MSNKTAEVLCIGTELLLGEITNTNAQFLAQQLAILGISHFYQTVVGDNVYRIQKALAIAAGRSNLIITTGGLGPTADDLTTQTIAEFFDTPLMEYPGVWATIQQRFEGREIPDSNRKQTLLPQGAEILPNPTGTAPGMIWEPKPGLVIMTFPGVPSELYRMWAETAIPWLHTQGWTSAPIWSRVLLYWGIGESALAERVSDLLALSEPATVAPYANYGQARLRITTKAPDRETARAIMEPIEAEILSRTGAYCYGFDEDTLEGVVGNYLRSAGQTLAIAESCTGGWLGQMITSVPGCSDYFLGGIITYSNQLKIDLLGVSPQDLEHYGAVSPIVAEQMALGVQQRLGSDWGISITGIAGPAGETTTKPVGLVYIGLATGGGVKSFEHRISPSKDRNWIRRVSACSALNHLRERFVMISNNQPGL